MTTWPNLPLVALAAGLWAGAGLAQSPAIEGGFINPNGLPPAFAAMHLRLGGRMKVAANALVTLSGTIADASGSRAATITVQTPGLMRYQESGTKRVLTYDGSQFKSKNSPGGAADSAIEESLGAHLADMVLLQVASGAALRSVGGRFRTDDGKTPNYTGPYWTLYALSPPAAPGLAAGQPPQQQLFIAIDEQSGLLAEVRVVDNYGAADQKVTQTQFGNWFQQSGQWFPGRIVRLENGQQTLSFQTQQASVGAQVGAATFEP